MQWQIASALDRLRAQNEQTNSSRDQLEKKLKDAEQVASAVKEDDFRVEGNLEAQRITVE
jgi:hypothetical protein